MGEMTWGVVVLAAGQGTRMKSDLPKVLHEAAGRTLVDRVLDRALEVTAPDRVVVVIGHGADRVREHVGRRGVRTAVQEPQLGTGDALRVGLSGLESVDAVMVLSGDVPLLTPATVAALREALAADHAAALLTAELADPGAYGRVVRDATGAVRRIVEAGDADADTLSLREVNAGVYAFRLAPLTAALAALAPDNAQGEYYLTDVAVGLRDAGERTVAVRLRDPDEMHGVNTRSDLARVARLVVRRTIDRLMLAGVTVVDPDSTWVEEGCRVDRDAVLEPGVVLRAGAHVGGGARVGAHAVLDGVEVAPGEIVAPLTHRAR